MADAKIKRLPSIYQQYFQRYVDASYQPRPIEPGAKKCIIKGWQANAATVAVPRDRDYGIGLRLGSQFPDGSVLAAVDVDRDEFVQFGRALVPTPCGRIGAKGVALFVRTRNEAAKFDLKLAVGGKAGEFLGAGSLCVIPPTTHPDAKQPYRWTDKPLLEVKWQDLPLVDPKLINAAFASEHLTAVMSGNDTHTPALQFVGQLVHASSDDALIERIINAALPGSYKGNTREELPGMIRDARRKLASGNWANRTKQDEPEFEIELFNAAGLVPKKQEWLWPGRIPRGTLSLLIGLPDMGKSHIFIDICARVTTGNSMPPSTEPSIYPQQSVLIVCTEDRVEYTLVPRLMAAGADMTRVNFLRYLRSKGGARRGLDLTQDVQRIEACLNENPEISLIVLDPISEFLGAKIDGHSNTAVRAVLGQLMDLLDQRNIAALGVSHLPKVKTGMVQTASIGSIGFSACARSSLLVVDEEEDVVGEDGEPSGERELTGRKLLTVNKGNLAAPEDRETLALKLEPKTLDHPHDEITVARVQWDGIKEVTARELWQDRKPKQQQATLRSVATLFIKNAMRDPKNRATFRARLSTEIETEAAAAGISATTLKRAKNQLGVRSEQRKGTGEWWWVVPADCEWGPDF